MKFRDFTLKEDVNQIEYSNFRSGVEAYKPGEWKSIEDLPEEIFYGILIRAAINAGWVEDVMEGNEYDDEVTAWVWTVEYFDNIPAGKAPIRAWGHPILTRWLEYKSLDPN